MNHRSIFLAILCGLLLVSCSSESQPGPTAENPNWNIPLNIHLQSYYKDASVRVVLDGQVIFSGEISTSALLGVAERLSMKRDSGSHFISVTVDGRDYGEDQFLLEKDLYIGIGYHDGEVTFRYSDEPFIYD